MNREYMCSWIYHRDTIIKEHVPVENVHFLKTEIEAEKENMKKKKKCVLEASHNHEK